MNGTIEERKLRKMYVRKNQLSLLKYARKVHGEYVVNTDNTTEECDAQYNRKCIYSVVSTALKVGWDVDSIRHIIDFLPLHCWNSKMVPPKYPQTVTLKFDSEQVKLGKCVLRADPKTYVSKRAHSVRHLAGRQWIDDQGFVLTSNFLEIPEKFVGGDLLEIVDALIDTSWVPGTFNHIRFGIVLPNGNFRFYRQHEGASFAPKESFGICDSNNFSQCMLVDVCA